MALERPPEKRPPLADIHSPLEPRESTVTDSSIKTQPAPPSLPDQNAGIDQDSLWPGIDIEMSFSQYESEWTVSSRQEQDGQEA